MAKYNFDLTTGQLIEEQPQQPIQVAQEQTNVQQDTKTDVADAQQETPKVMPKQPTPPVAQPKYNFDMTTGELKVENTDNNVPTTQVNEQEYNGKKLDEIEVSAPLNKAYNPAAPTDYKSQWKKVSDQELADYFKGAQGQYDALTTNDERNQFIDSHNAAVAEFNSRTAAMKGQKQAQKIVAKKEGMPEPNQYELEDLANTKVRYRDRYNTMLKEWQDKGLTKEKALEALQQWYGEDTRDQATKKLHIAALTEFLAAKEDNRQIKDVNDEENEELFKKIDKEYPQLKGNLRKYYDNFLNGVEGFDTRQETQIPSFKIAGSIIALLNTRMADAQRVVNDTNGGFSLAGELGDDIGSGVHAQSLYIKASDYDDAKAIVWNKVKNDLSTMAYCMSYAKHNNVSIEQAFADLEYNIDARVENYLVEKNTPHDNFEYAAKHLLQDTMIGKLLTGAAKIASGTGDHKTALTFSELADQEYIRKHNTWQDQALRGTVSAGTFLLDVGTGGFFLPSQASNAVASAVTTGLTGYGKGVATRMLTGFVDKTLPQIAGGAANFGTYDMLSTIAHGMASDKGISNWRDLGYSFFTGAAKGSWFGAIGGTIGHLTEGATGVLAVGGEALKIAGEGIPFLALDYINTGEITLESIIANTGMVMTGRLKHPVAYAREVKSRIEGTNKGLKAVMVKLPDADARVLSGMGYPEIAKMLQREYGGVEGRMDAIEGEYNKLLEDTNVPLNYVRMAQWALDGRFTPTVMATKVGGIKDENGNITEPKKNEDGTYDVIRYDVNGRAINGAPLTVDEKTYESLKQEARLGRITMYEKNLDNQVIMGSVANACYNYAVSHMGEPIAQNPQELFVTYKNLKDKKNNGEKLNDTETKLLKDIDALFEKEENYSAVYPIKQRLNKQYGVDVDKLLTKPESELTAQEHKALDVYETALAERVTNIDDVSYFTKKHNDAYYDQLAADAIEQAKIREAQVAEVKEKKTTSANTEEMAKKNKPEPPKAEIPKEVPKVENKPIEKPKVERKPVGSMTREEAEATYKELEERMGKGEKISNEDMSVMTDIESRLAELDKPMLTEEQLKELAAQPRTEEVARTMLENGYIFAGDRQVWVSRDGKAEIPVPKRSTEENLAEHQSLADQARSIEEQIAGIKGNTKEKSALKKQAEELYEKIDDLEATLDEQGASDNYTKFAPSRPLKNKNAHPIIQEYEKAEQEMAKTPKALEELRDKEPRTAEEYISQCFRGAQLLFKDKGNVKGVASHAGVKWNDVKGLSFLFNNKDGIGLERFAEQIWADMPEQFRNEMGDMMNVLDHVISVISRAKTLGDIYHEIKSNRIRSAREILDNGGKTREEIEQELWENAQHQNELDRLEEENEIFMEDIKKGLEGMSEEEIDDIFLPAQYSEEKDVNNKKQDNGRTDNETGDGISATTGSSDASRGGDISKPQDNKGGENRPSGKTDAESQEPSRDRREGTKQPGELAVNQSSFDHNLVVRDKKVKQLEQVNGKATNAELIKVNVDENGNVIADVKLTFENGKTKTAKNVQLEQVPGDTVVPKGEGRKRNNVIARLVQKITNENIPENEKKLARISLDKLGVTQGKNSRTIKSSSETLYDKLLKSYANASRKPENLSEVDKKAIDFVKEKFGYEVKLVPKIVLDENGDANGRIDFANKVIYLSQDAEYDKSLRWVLGHELEHGIKKADAKAYEAFKDAVVAKAGQKKIDEAIDNRLEFENWENTPENREAALEEIVSDQAGNLFDDADFAREVLGMMEPEQRKSFITKALDYIKGWLGFGNKEGKETWTELQKTWNDMLQQTADGTFEVASGESKNSRKKKKYPEYINKRLSLQDKRKLRTFVKEHFTHPGTDTVELDNYVYLIDHSDREGIGSGEKGDGFGAHFRVNVSGLSRETINELKEEIENSYGKVNVSAISRAVMQFESARLRNRADIIVHDFFKIRGNSRGTQPNNGVLHEANTSKDEFRGSRPDNSGKDDRRASDKRIDTPVNEKDKNSRKGADLYRDKEEYKEGQVLEIKGDLDGYTVEGMTMPQTHPETLLEAWRNKHPEYYAFLTDDHKGIEVYPVEGGKTRLEAMYDKARSSKQRQQYVERKAKMMRERAENTAKPLGVKVNIIEPGTETDADRLKSKGWYDTNTGEINVILGNHTDEWDVRTTVLREAVANHGLRKYVGEENYNEWLQEVYNTSYNDVKKRINEIADKQGISSAEATEEYLANLAEDMSFTDEHPSWWSRVKSGLKDLIQNILDKNKANVGTLYTFSDNDLRYILWSSYNHLKMDAEQYKVTDAEVRKNLGVGQLYAAEDSDVKFSRKGYKENNITDEKKEKSGMIVWHGSAAEFDKFDSSHFLKGEGNMSYGAGHYVTDVEKTGRHYAQVAAEANANKTLAERDIQDRADDYPSNSNLSYAEKWNQSRDELIKAAKEELDSAKRYAESPEDYEEEERIYNELKSARKYEEFTGRQLYQVEIPNDNGSNYIEWMKTLPKQGRERIADVVRNLPIEQLDTENHGPNWLRDGWNTLANVIERGQLAGLEITEKLQDAFKDDKAINASKVLSDAGFVGMKVPTGQQQGGDGKGTNYVIFKDSDLQIKNREKFSRKRPMEDSEEARTRREKALAYTAEQLQDETRYHENAVARIEQMVERLRQQPIRPGRATAMMELRNQLDSAREALEQARKNETAAVESNPRDAVREWNNGGLYTKSEMLIEKTDAQMRMADIVGDIDGYTELNAELADLRAKRKQMVRSRHTNESLQDLDVRISEASEELREMLSKLSDKQKADLIREEARLKLANTRLQAIDDLPPMIPGNGERSFAKATGMGKAPQKIDYATDDSNIDRTLPLDDPTRIAQEQDFERRQEEDEHRYRTDRNNWFKQFGEHRAAWEKYDEEYDAWSARQRGYRNIILALENKLTNDAELQNWSARSGKGETLADKYMSTGGIDVSASTAASLLRDMRYEHRRTIEHATGEDNVTISGLKQILKEAVGNKNDVKAAEKELIGMLQGTQKVPEHLKQTVQLIHNWFEDMFQWQMSNGMTDYTKHRKNYVPQIWDIDKSRPDADAQTRLEKYDLKGTSTESAFMNQRVYDTYEDGINHGLVPKYESIFDLMRAYGNQVNKSIANKQYINTLRAMRMPVKRAINVNGEWVDVEVHVPVIIEEGESSNKQDYRPLQNTAFYRDGKPQYLILRPKDKDSSLFLSEVRATLGESEEVGKVGAFFDRLSSVMKGSMLKLSGFHHVALTEHYFGLYGNNQGGVARAAYNIIVEHLGKTLLTGETNVERNPEDAMEARTHFVKFGESSDYDRKASDIMGLFHEHIGNTKSKWWMDFVNAKTDAEREASAIEILKGTFGIKGLKALDVVPAVISTINKYGDRFLWEVVHDGYKLDAYREFKRRTMEKAKKYGWDETRINKELDECGQRVNDMYGGQHWDLLKFSPKLNKLLRRAMLSPDWNASWMRLLAGTLGMGKLYNESEGNMVKRFVDGRRFFKRGEDGKIHIVESDEGATAQKAAALVTILSALRAGIAWSILNYVMRKKDEEEQMNLAEKIRNGYTDENGIVHAPQPEYKTPYERAGVKPDDWAGDPLGTLNKYALTPWNSLNDPGKGTYLFIGRDESGRSRYIRWGKQMREAYALGYNEYDEFDPTGSLAHEAINKANPVIGSVYHIMTGRTLNGWEDRDMKNKTGLDLTLARIKVAALAFTPMSIGRGEDLDAWNMFLPKSKGLSSWTATERMTRAMLRGDDDEVERIKRACLMNGVDYTKVVQTAQKNAEMENNDPITKGLKNPEQVLQKYNETTDLDERKKLEKKYKTMTATFEQSLDDVVEDAKEKVSKNPGLDKYKSTRTASDFEEDWIIERTAKNYEDAGVVKGFNELGGEIHAKDGKFTFGKENKEAAKEFYENHKQELRAVMAVRRWDRRIKKLTKDMGKDAYTDKATMTTIRYERQRKIGELAAIARGEKGNWSKK